MLRAKHSLESLPILRNGALKTKHSFFGSSFVAGAK
jgi:hypothetical protein